MPHKMVTAKDIDHAFEMLLIMLTALTAALFQYFTYAPQVAPALSVEKGLKFLFFPLFISIVAYFASLLTEKKRLGFFLKCFSWFYTLVVMGFDLEIMIVLVFRINLEATPQLPYIGPIGPPLASVAPTIIAFLIQWHAAQIYYEALRGKVPAFLVILGDFIAAAVFVIMMIVSLAM